MVMIEEQRNPNISSSAPSNSFVQYLRQMALPQFGMQGQERLKKSRVLIVGMGGLGTPVVQYLSAAGVGNIGIVDGDKVDTSNLPRQVLYTEADIGRWKVEVIAEELQQKNKNIQIDPYAIFLDETNATSIIKQYDVIVNGTDQFQISQLINQVCVQQNKPWVDAGVVQFYGQITTFIPQKGCFHCLYPETIHTLQDCSTLGILGPLCGIFGSMQALETIKIILGITSEENQVFSYDGLRNHYQAFTWRKNNACPCCSQVTAAHRPQKKEENFIISTPQFLELLAKPNNLVVGIDFPGEQEKLGQAPLKRKTLTEILHGEMKEYRPYDQVIFICLYGLKSRLAAEYVRSNGIKRCEWVIFF